MEKLLISGIPGTGKTTVANYLAEHLGYTHLDMEMDSFKPRRELERDSRTFLSKLAEHSKVVLSWGFGPYMDRPAVEKLLAAGYTFVWLEGDHVASLRNFLTREHHDPRQEANYYGQMQTILATEIVERLRPIQIDPFEKGKLRPVEAIAEEIIAQVTPASKPKRLP